MDFRKLLKETKEQSAKENLVSETFETALEEAVPVKAAPKKASSRGMDQAAAFLGKEKQLTTKEKWTTLIHICRNSNQNVEPINNIKH